MFKAVFLILFFYTTAVIADDNDEVCLGVKKIQPDKLTFFYTRQDESDKPYFYAKLTNKEAENTDITFDFIQSLVGRLAYVPETNPHQYQIPAKVKKLYVVKSKVKLTEFDSLAQVVPTIRDEETDIVDLPVRRKRNAGNHPHPLPAETKKTRGLVAGDDNVKVCDFLL